jgi:hypothetical protein
MFNFALFLLNTLEQLQIIKACNHDRNRIQPQAH